MMNVKKIASYCVCAGMLFVGSTTFCASQEAMSTDSYRLERTIEAQLLDVKAEVKALLPRLEDDQITSLVENIGQNVGVERIAEIPALIEMVLGVLDSQGGDSYLYREREIIEMAAYAHAHNRGIVFDAIPELLQGARRERVDLERLEQERIMAGCRGNFAPDTVSSDADFGDSSGFETAQEELSEDEFYDAQDVPQDRVLGDLPLQLQQIIFGQLDPQSLRATVHTDKGAADALADMKIVELLHKNNYDAKKAFFNLAKNPDFKEWPLPALHRVLTYLLDNGVGIDELDTTDQNARTALMYAAELGHNVLIEALLEAGVDPRVQDNYRITALHLAASYGHAGTVEVLLAVGVDPMVQGNSGRTALHWAAGNGHTGIVEVLRAAGVDPMVQDNCRRTALHFAAESGHAGIVELLRAAGVDPRLQNRFGMNALHLAAGNGHAGTVELLLAAGVDPRVQNRFGMNALHLAAGNGHAGTVEVLLAAGVDPSLQDDEGNTALDLAIQNNHADVVAILKRKIKREVACVLQ